MGMHNETHKRPAKIITERTLKLWKQNLSDFISMFDHLSLLQLSYYWTEVFENIVIWL